MLMNFIIIGESANRLPEAFLLEQAHIPWRSIAGFRNIIAHNYFGIDADEVWEIIQKDLPVLIQQIADLPQTKY